MTTTYELYTNENGTPKAVEGKAPAIIERVEALETSVENLGTSVENFETSVENLGTSVENLGTSVENLETSVETAQATADACLPLSGGTMTGAIKFGNSSIYSSGGNYKGLDIFADINRGAELYLYSKDSPTDAGSFRLQARNADIYYALEGNVNGELLWDGRSLFPSFDYGAKTWLTLDTVHRMASDGLIFAEAQREGNNYGTLETFINGKVMWASSNNYSYGYGYYFVKKGDTVKITSATGNLAVAVAHFMPVRY